MRDLFWEQYPLADLAKDEWEALCDGCALCCLVKLQDEDSGDIAITDLSCTLLDVETCKCQNYPDRQSLVPDCAALNVERVGQFSWLPVSCAYRCLAEGRALPQWHYLISGDRNLVHEVQASAKHLATPQQLVDEDEWQDRVIHWVEN